MSTATATPVVWHKRLFAKKAEEASYPKLPEASESGETSVPGLFIAGEVSGTPLIKLGLNQGYERAGYMLESIGELAKHGDADAAYDLVIVGGGPAGLGALDRARQMNAKVLLVEGEKIATTVERMYKGKVLFAEPVKETNRTSWWFEECTREELLKKWRAALDEGDLPIHEHEKLTAVKGKIDAFDVVTEKKIYRAKRVMLAIGKAGNPRKAGVPGEIPHAEKVQRHLVDPKAIQDEHILIYGGGDVACEAAIALATPRDDENAGTATAANQETPNEVTLVVRSASFTRPNRRNTDAVHALAERGLLKVHFSSSLKKIDAEIVTFKDGKGIEQEIKNDRVLELIGAELPLKFFKKTGIRMEGEWTPLRIFGLLISSLLVYSLYALKKFPDAPYSWPFYNWFTKQEFADFVTPIFDVCFSPFAWMFTDKALADMHHINVMWFQQGYLYSLAYTVLMAVLGVSALKRWSRINQGKSEKKRNYQKYRYASLITFQITFFMIANVIALQGISLQNAWRAWGLYQPWPLFFNTFHWFNTSDSKAIILAFMGAGLVGTFVAIPILSRYHGKRFCTWVCGCGGLAETLGDRWRHLAAKGERSRIWEFQGLVIFVFAAIATFITVGIFDTMANNSWASAYSYIVDFWLVAVIPITLYPFYGGKVWCRYWCPLAAYNGLLAKLYGKLNISSDSNCISCTQCSKFCQVGVDVMKYAKNGESFSNRETACIQCGICIDVCPMDVLSFDNTARKEGDKGALRVLQ
ncbi:MAG: NAD(P)-binding domain-containing protein [Deltaproteobacteria bacterium]|nr:NAD(P)-binding domain-containing protein [Deltaproteobacteria bacterium]